MVTFGVPNYQGILSHHKPRGNLRRALSPPVLSHAGPLPVSDNECGMTDPADRVPKAYRNRLHRLKNAYRKTYRREPELDRPVTEEAAIEAIDFLEHELRRAGVPLPEEFEPRIPGSKKGHRS